MQSRLTLNSQEFYHILSSTGIGHEPPGQASDPFQDSLDLRQNASLPAFWSHSCLPQGLFILALGVGNLISSPFPCLVLSEMLCLSATRPSLTSFKARFSGHLHRQTTPNHTTWSPSPLCHQIHHSYARTPVSLALCLEPGDSR